ncbi:MAG TPA: DMT family transporter [Gemmatimonadales bacterium]|nr:DMT family transporter [Gemmatimonadales bacterium]
MIGLAVVALLCFAANSVLARLALGPGLIDPASFTAIRLLSGAIVLSVILRARGGPAAANSTGRWTGAILLFLYAAPFSFAYVSLPAGTGALLLFGAVQLTMISAGLRSGERPHAMEWVGLMAALAGLVYLNLPGLGAPSVHGAALMLLAGGAWGLYSLRGRSGGAPLPRTSESFLFATPLGLALAAGWNAHSHLSSAGIGFAVASGAIASGLGYAAWYSVLPRLTATRAGTIQLAVPVVAALAGTLLIGERVSARLALSAVAILGGVGLAISAKARASR